MSFARGLTLGLMFAVSCSARPDRAAQAPTPPAVVAPTDHVAAAEAAPESAPSEFPATAPESALGAAGPDAATIAQRVASARDRLSRTEPGRLVWASIEAAGGLTAWFDSGPLRFRFKYAPIGRPATDTIQIVDTWASRVRHQLTQDPSIEFAWDGRRAWISPADADPGTNPRFWSLTPYYFVGIPWVLADPGVVLESMPDAEFEGRAYQLVRASFEAGTGDAPDDYYVLYIDKQTSRVRAIRYVVSYRGFRPDGGHGPEKLMSYDGDLVAGPLTFAASHRTFKYDEGTGQLGELVTETTVSDLEFVAPVAADFFDAPPGARLIEGWK